MAQRGDVTEGTAEELDEQFAEACDYVRRALTLMERGWRWAMHDRLPIPNCSVYHSLLASEPFDLDDVQIQDFDGGVPLNCQTPAAADLASVWKGCSQASSLGSDTSSPERSRSPHAARFSSSVTGGRHVIHLGVL